MDNFLFNVLTSVTASYIVYLISKLIKKVKSHSTAKSDLKIDINFKYHRKK
ncbi:TPA: hypothetical protein KQV61_000268 [Clostridioides difficile]|nr:hypothetical protein [Clostridioides difficile]